MTLFAKDAPAQPTEAGEIVATYARQMIALHDEMVKMQMDAKDQTIASQQAAINKLELTAYQCAQNQYLVNQLRPAAVPAFTVPNPYANYGFGCYCGSNNNGCC